MIEFGAAQADGSLSITVEAAGGEEILRVFEPGTEDVEMIDIRDGAALGRSWYDKDQDTKYWAVSIPDRDVVYIQFNSVTEAEDQSLDAFAQEVGTLLRQAEPQRVIVDLRRNTGGNSRLSRSLARELTAWNGASEPGGLVMLIGPGTISAAVVFAQDVERFAPVVFIGEPTTSDRNQWGDNVRYEMVNSGVSVMIATKFFQSGGPYAWPGPIRPQRFIQQQGADFMAVNDPVLDAAFAYAPSPQMAEIYQRSEPAGGVIALRALLDDPELRYLDVERPLRLLSGEVADVEPGAGLEISELLVARYPERSLAHIVYAERLEEVGRGAEAISALEQALAIMDDDISLYHMFKLRVRDYAENLVATFSEHDRSSE